MTVCFNYYPVKRGRLMSRALVTTQAYNSKVNSEYHLLVDPHAKNEEAKRQALAPMVEWAENHSNGNLDPKVKSPATIVQAACNQFTDLV
jgi:hypothetical protein